MLELDSKGMHYVCVKKFVQKPLFYSLDAIFKSQNALNSKFSGALPQTPLGELTALPQVSRPPLLEFDKYSLEHYIMYD